MSNNAGNALPTEENLRMASSSLASGMPMSIAYRSPASDVSELNSNGTEKSIDERVFSDFTIDGTAKDFKQIQLDENKLAAYEQKEKEKNDDIEGMVREQAMAEMKKMLSIGGYEFSEAALDDVVDGILDDPDAFADKHDLSPEEMDQVMILATLLENAPDSDAKKQILKDWQKDQPDIVRAVVKEASEETLKRELSNIEANAQKNADALSDANTVDEKKAVVETDVWNVSTERAVAEHAEVIAEVKDERLESESSRENSWDIDAGGSTSFAELQAGATTTTASISDSFSNATSPSETSGVTVASNDMKNAFGLG